MRLYVDAFHFTTFLVSLVKQVFIRRTVYNAHSYIYTKKNGFQWRGSYNQNKTPKFLRGGVEIFGGDGNFQLCAKRGGHSCRAGVYSSFYHVPSKGSRSGFGIDLRPRRVDVSFPPTFAHLWLKSVVQIWSKAGYIFECTPKTTEPGDEYTRMNESWHTYERVILNI